MIFNDFIFEVFPYSDESITNHVLSLKQQLVSAYSHALAPHNNLVARIHPSASVCSHE